MTGDGCKDVTSPPDPPPPTDVEGVFNIDDGACNAESARMTISALMTAGLETVRAIFRATSDFIVLEDKNGEEELARSWVFAKELVISNAQVFGSIPPIVPKDGNTTAEESDDVQSADG